MAATGEAMPLWTALSIGLVVGLVCLCGVSLFLWPPLWRAVRLSPGQRQARFDLVTGLLSREPFMLLFESCVERSRRQCRECGVLVFELSNYRALVRRHGKRVGEVALMMCAHHVTRIANQGDITARVGDSTFALVTEGCLTKEQLQNLGVVLLAKTYRTSDMLPPGAKLQLHIVASVVDGHHVTAQQAFERLSTVVQTSTEGRSRPVQIMDLSSPRATEGERAPG